MSDLAGRVDRLADAIARRFQGFVAITLICLVLVVPKLVERHGADPDLFARVAVGELVTASRGVPLHDPFAFTPKKQIWVDHEWLSGVVFYELARLGGDALLLVFKLALAFLTIIMLLRAADIWDGPRRGAALWSALCILEASFLWGSTVRCRSFTYLFLAVLLRGIVHFERARQLNWLILATATFPIWTNVHGGFALGLMIFGVYAGYCCLQVVRKRSRVSEVAKVGLLFMVSIASTACNPYGFSTYWHYFIEALSMPRPTISEWAPVWSDTSSALLLMAFVGPLLIGGMKQRPSLLAFIMLVVSLYLGARAVRLWACTMFVFVIFGRSLFESFVIQIEEFSGRFSTMLARALSLVTAAAAIPLSLHALFLLWTVPSWRFDLSSYPVEALRVLRNCYPDSSGRLLIDFNNGSFALWRLYPSFLVSIDGRYEELYPESTNEMVGKALTPLHPEWKEAFESVNPTHLVIHANVQKLFQERLASPWRVINEDSAYAVLARSSPAIVGCESFQDSPLWYPARVTISRNNNDNDGSAAPGESDTKGPTKESQ